jgi:hypothetical protein
MASDFVRFNTEYVSVLPLGPNYRGENPNGGPAVRRLWSLYRGLSLTTDLHSFEVVGGWLSPVSVS